jgi:hypothetical protein
VRHPRPKARPRPSPTTKRANPRKTNPRKLDAPIKPAAANGGHGGAVVAADVVVALAARTRDW